MTEFDLVSAANKKTYIRIVLLNDAYQEVDQMEGELIDASLVISRESLIRRVANLSFHIANLNELGRNYFGAWMDRMVQLLYGIYDVQSKEIQWTLVGSFLFTASGYRVDVSNRQMNLSIADMMAATTEERGTQIGTDIEYLADTNVADALKSTVARFSPYKRYDIVEFEDKIPYDIRIAKGSYPHEPLNALVSLFPWYEQFYSREGVYTVRKVTTTMQDPVALDAEQMDEVVINENGDLDYSSVKNATEIWGKEIDANYTAIGCTSENNVYKLTIHSTYEKNEEGALICFTPDADSIAGQQIQVQNLESASIYKEAGNGEQSELVDGELQAGRAYVVKYLDGKFVLQGEAMIHVMCMEYNAKPTEQEIAYLKEFHNCNDIRIIVNPDSPFACDVIGVVKQVLQDGEYTNIYTTELALERAAYENWKTTRLQDMITIEALYIPSLDVNQKVMYKSIATGITAQYLVKEIRANLITGIMTVSLVKFYPLYPWVDDAIGAEWLIVEDDDNGNVRMYSNYDNAIKALDDGIGNVEIVFNYPFSIKDDGLGNITLIPLAIE